MSFTEVCAVHWNQMSREEREDFLRELVRVCEPDKLLKMIAREENYNSLTRELRGMLFMSATTEGFSVEKFVTIQHRSH